MLLILTLFGCNQNNGSTETMKTKIQLTYEVIPEDYDRNLYYVNWIDTLGLGEGYLPDKLLERPKEIWCIISNKESDTLGHYTGLSMAQTFAYFQTTDSIVTLNFMIGLNISPDKFKNDTTGLMAYWEANKTPVEFEPFEVNIYKELRKKTEIELKEK